MKEYDININRCGKLRIKIVKALLWILKLDFKIYEIPPQNERNW